MVILKVAGKPRIGMKFVYIIYDNPYTEEGWG
jgi:hypothetical protein